MSDLLISLIADWLVIVVAVVGGVGFLILNKKDRYQAIGKALVMAVTALLLAKVASLIYQGERPFVTMGTEPGAAFLNNPGFPSDHALLVFTVTFIVWASTKNAVFGGVLLGMSLLVSLGRVLALVHTPIDVVGAAICALLAATIVYGRQLYSPK